MTVSVAMLARAIRFYEHGPDGQYDRIAAACIKEVYERVKCDLRDRKLDRWVKKKYGVNARRVMK
jgi:hypothetical protein